MVLQYEAVLQAFEGVREFCPLLPFRVFYSAVVFPWQVRRFSGYAKEV